MYCINCGNTVPDGALFCTSCGTRQNYDADAPAPETEPYDATEILTDDTAEDDGAATEMLSDIAAEHEPPNAAVIIPDYAPTRPHGKKGRAAIIFMAGIIAAALMCTAVAIIAPPGAVLAAENWMSLGEKYLLELDYEQAVIALQKAIEIEPRNIEARLKLAEAYIALERYDEAEETLFEVLDIDGKNTDAYIALQGLYEMTGDMAALSSILEEMRSKGLEEYILFGEAVGLIIDGFDAFEGIERALPGVDVRITKAATSVRSAATGMDGMFSVLLRGGEYTLTAAMTGYMSAVNDFSVYPNETANLPTLAMIPESDEPGSVSGTVIDALTGHVLAGADIAVYDSRGDMLESMTANGDGIYVLTQTAGYYRIAVSAEGYAALSVTVPIFGGLELYNQNLAVTPILGDGEMRAVLTWGERPSDLDSHLIGPRGDGTDFHIFFSARTAALNGVIVADLDLDDTDRYGPETTSIYAASPGKYSFFVYDYSNGGHSDSTELARSGAKVRVYIGGETDVREFNVPPGLVGDTWYVFDFEDGRLRMPGSDVYDGDAGSEYISDDEYGYAAPVNSESYSQKIEIISETSDPTRAALTLYEWSAGEWRSLYETGARVGANGVGDDYGEGKKITPKGTYNILFCYGISAPETNLRFRPLQSDSVFVDDSSSGYYNTIVSSSLIPATVSRENTYSQFSGRTYSTNLFFDYNGDGETFGTATPYKGSVYTVCGYVGTLKATAGCIDISSTDMAQLLRLLDSDKRPVIIIS
jgi:L,D-peptidoglycan transpeptidase YkuD (ErfK/YbiS/YcfS/YnhG family)